MEDSVENQQLAVLRFHYHTELDASRLHPLLSLTLHTWCEQLVFQFTLLCGKSIHTKSNLAGRGYLAYASDHSLHQRKSEQELKQGVKQQHGGMLLAGMFPGP